VKDPLRAQRGAGNLGAAGLRRGAEPNWELGVIVTYNSGTHTSVVRTHSGRTLQDVPQIKATASGFDHISTGTTVVVAYDLGFPAIIGCIDLPRRSASAALTPSLTGVEGVGDADAAQITQGTSSFKPGNAPTDMGAGDWAQIGTQGNHVAVMEGGVTLLGSPTAHIQSIGPSGTLRTVARRFQQFSDFGEMRIENDRGKTSYILRAGSNQSTQTGLDEQHWTIRLDLGASGDVLDFRIQEPEGKLLFRLHAGPDGRVQLFGEGGVDISSGTAGAAEMRHDIAGSRTAEIDGDDVQNIGGNINVTAGASATRAVGFDDTLAVVRNRSVFIGGDHDVGISGAKTHVVGGARVTRVGKDDTTEVDGSSTTKAARTLTVDGRQVKLGANATQSVVRGIDFGSQVLAPISAAATGLVAGAASANLIAAALPGPPVTTPASVAALSAAVAAFGSAVISAIGAFSGTLSTKVKTE
jgi:hypothetical protein